jgi:preprotein translocase subunit YajC
MNLHGLIILADAAAQPQGGPPTITTFVPFILMFVVLYFVMIRPQSKKAKELANLVKAMKPGDKVLTSSGIVGIVVSVKDKTVAIRSADTKLEVLKSAVSEITERAGESKSDKSDES